MAKKQPARERDAGKTRFELRFDEELYERTKKLADRAGISMNQLMQGLTRWFLQHAHTGEPYRNEGGWVQMRPQEGCVWAGRHARSYSEDERQEMADAAECSLKDVPHGEKGEILFVLDFTERRVVRDDV